MPRADLTRITSSESWSRFLRLDRKISINWIIRNSKFWKKSQIFRNFRNIPKIFTKLGDLRFLEGPKESKFSLPGLANFNRGIFIPEIRDFLIILTTLSAGISKIGISLELDIPIKSHLYWNLWDMSFIL